MQSDTLTDSIPQPPKFPKALLTPARTLPSKLGKRQRNSVLDDVGDDDGPLHLFDNIVDIVFTVVYAASCDPLMCKRGGCDTPPIHESAFC